MKTRISILVALACAGQANAIDLKTTNLTVYQVGTGSLVKVGHVVHASTNYNRLTAGGSFVASCAHQITNLPITGNRSLFTENAFGGLRLDVTIPAQQPAHRNMPGFNALPRGTTINCTYNWTSIAVEGGYTVGVGGTSFQTGNGSVSEGGSEHFIMNVPGTSSSEDNSVCIP